MPMYIRRLVSGSKARLIDDELGTDLDLVYVTKQIIVMGFPATGLESIYRNRRADVQRFLSARHGQDFWVFNFCPISENSYDEGVFDGRVSRYPFPDHNVPPFPYMSLVTREIGAWLSGSDARVAVLHCKAGKGRSGTMACAYLLACSLSPAIPELDTRRTLRVADLVRDGDTLEPNSSTLEDAEVKTVQAMTDSWHQKQSDMSRDWIMVRTVSESPRDRFEQVLDLYTIRRMKPAVQQILIHKQKRGVSIPSQQRWLRYWSQSLATDGSTSSGPEGSLELRKYDCRKVRITRVVVRMRELSGIQPSLIQAVSMVQQATNVRSSEAASSGCVWASLARYDDDLVGRLAELSPCQSSETPRIFEDGKWDREKMIRKFATMSTGAVEVSGDGSMGARLFSFALISSPGEGWTDVFSQDFHHPQQGSTPLASSLDSLSYSVIHPSSSNIGCENDSGGIIVHANRELRLKIFWGRATLGWIWFIPAFHICPEAASSVVVFTRPEVDFAMGMGKSLVDVNISIASCTD
ncbi:hypothetical protein BKA82DRAFT_4068421 [Pisolithus tinctorius]|nr:hypothetical protein BKA82DRAFT_4068421 [Pisolithus tinctorius]